MKYISEFDLWKASLSLSEKVKLELGLVETKRRTTELERIELTKFKDNLRKCQRTGFCDDAGVVAWFLRPVTDSY